MSYSHTLLVISENADRTARYSEEAARLGIALIAAEFTSGRLRIKSKKAPDAILFDFAAADTIPSEKLVLSLEKHYAPKRVPMVASQSSNSIGKLPIEVVRLYPPYSPARVMNRMRAAIRLAHIETELELRRQTLKDVSGKDLDVAQHAIRKDPLRILFAGKASPEFLSLIHAVKDDNVDVVGAFTSFTAFDYLNDMGFDGVVLNALDDVKSAASIARTMRRNSKLYHVPALLLVDGDSFEPDDVIFIDGVSDIIPKRVGADEIKGRLVNLAREYRYQDQLKSLFTRVPDQDCIDIRSGLMTRSFFETHIARGSRHAHKTKSPYSLAVLSCAPQAGLSLTPEIIIKAEHQTASLLKSLVRVQDFGVRIDRNTFAIAFPAQALSDARDAMSRLTEILKHTGCENIAGARPFTMSCRYALGALKPGESGQALFSRVYGQLRRSGKVSNIA